MKKHFLLIFFFSYFLTFPVFAEYTTTVPTEYNNTEYNANGSALTAIGADKAYTGENEAYSGYSGTGVTVAVIDGGTMTSHPDLSKQISSLQKDEFNVSEDSHGTHVSGIIGAEKNDTGMHGVAYNSDLIVFSALLDGTCTDTEDCMDPGSAWNALLSDEYDAVKIINNSWGLNEDKIDDATWGTIYDLMSKMIEKDKLIIAAAGNNMELNPNAFPAGVGAYNSEFINNIINVVAYDSEKSPSDRNFISPFSNLAGNAQKWTLSAPGQNIYSTILYEEDGAQYDNNSGTSMATPMVSGAAALVQEAFPYLGGKQIADILFSTAFKKEDLTLNSYMIQSHNGQTRVLLFTDLAQSTLEQAKSDAANDGYICGESVSCHEVTFADVFGQGLLNVGDAVKGIKYFDASRLAASDYDSEMNQFFYSVNTLGMNSTWSNDIGQQKMPSGDHMDANVGLKKQGDGILTLAGANTYLGTTVVEGGELNLTGSLSGQVVVNGGTFSMSESSQMEQNITVNTGGSFRMDNGTLTGILNNNGSAQISNGFIGKDIINTGTFSITASAIPNATVEISRLTNKNTLNLATGALLTGGELRNESGGTINVTGNSSAKVYQLTNQSNANVVVNSGGTLTNNFILNHGTLSGFGTITGAVQNESDGSVASSLTFENLSSVGNIIMAAAESGTGTAVMHVDNLDIKGGKLVIGDANITYENEQRYTLIEFNNLSAFKNFAPQSMLSDFISATVHQETDRIDVTIDYQRMSEAAATSFFQPEEKTVAGIMDKMYLDNNNTDFKAYYYLNGKDLQKEINTIRSKAKPIQKEHLPLTSVMSSQVSAHLFKMNMNRDAAVFHHRRYTPMQQYRGKYYRGRAGGNAYTTDRKIWGQILGGRVVEDGDSSLNKGDATTRTIGGMIGYDREVSPHLLVGVTAGFATGRLTQDSDEIKVKDYRAGIYTGSRFGQITINSLLLAGFQQYKSTRYTEVIGVQTLGKSDFNGYSAELDLKLGYDLMRLPYRDYSFYLQPYLAANVSYIFQDSYEEKGNSALLLGVDSIDNTSFSVQPGITIGYTFSQAVLTADFGYQRILSGDSVQTSAYFLADTAKETFDSLSAESDKDYFNAGIGLKTNISRNTVINLWAGTRISDKTEALNFSASVSYAF